MDLEVKVPTDDEYQAFTGAHCSSNWKKVGEKWTCPVCGRNRKQIMRWNVKESRWTCGLHEHHDHESKFNFATLKRVGARFPDTIICGACNQLDVRLKKAIGANYLFSFSPDELRECINRDFVPANAPIPLLAIDIEKAHAFYQLAKESKQ